MTQYKPSLKEEMFWEFCDKTPMSLEEIKRRQAINEAFIADWKRQHNVTEQPRIVGDMPDEVPFQSKAAKKALGRSIARPNYDPTDDESARQHRRLVERSNRNGK